MYACAHDFKYIQKGCNSTVQRYLDIGDAKSTSNMCKYVRKCWEMDMLAAADDTKDTNEAWWVISGGSLWERSITPLFQ